MAPDVSVVIPTHNRLEVLSEVLQALEFQHEPPTFEVIVVDDGSSDGTADEAAKAGAVVLSRPSSEPGSKARALALGVEASSAPVLVFFDADILDVRPDCFEALAAPVLAGEAWLSCGMISYGRLRDPFFLRLPPITGLRAIRREVFEAIPDAKRNGFQIEIMINEVIARRGLPSTIRVLPGLRHRSKVQKVGWRRGLPSHLSMTRELLACLRFVPLWTYRAYLSHLKVLPPAGSSAPQAHCVRKA